MRPGRTLAGPRATRGVTLVELMVALVLGLVVVAAALAVFLANRQTYVAAQDMGRMQEASRVAFELMSRDIREAGGGVCGNDGGDVVNVLNSPAANWYTDFAGGVRGYPATTPFADAAFGTGAGARVQGTEAIELKSAYQADVTIAKHDPPSAQFKANTVAHDMSPGDIVMACDAEHATIFQVTNASPGTNDTIVHNTGASTPGNCTKGLGFPVDCSSTTGTAYEFGCAYGGTKPSIDCTLPENRWTAYLARVQALRWYVGCNGRADCATPAGRSLYRSRVANSGGALGVVSDEIATGVTGLAFRFLLADADDYVADSTALDWSKVLAVDVEVATGGQDLVDGQRIARTLHNVVTLRSRAP